jgi:hypothetical protein
MPQMWQPQRSSGLWQFLRQNFEKELDLAQDLKEPPRPSNDFRPPKKRSGLINWVIFMLLAFLFHCITMAACKHMPEDVLPKSEEAIKTFDAHEKVVLKAIARVLKDRGFGDSKVSADGGRLETDYVVQEDWRTRVVATLKKISRKETEVTLSVMTEKKSSSGWQPKQVMGKEQYDKLFDEIEMQIYRELYRGE